MSDYIKAAAIVFIFLLGSASESYADTSIHTCNMETKPKPFKVTAIYDSNSLKGTLVLPWDSVTTNTSRIDSGQIKLTTLFYDSFSRNLVATLLGDSEHGVKIVLTITTHDRIKNTVKITTFFGNCTK